MSRGYSHGLSWKNDDGKWNYSLIESKIKEAMDILNIHRFPSKDELIRIDYSNLSNTISRSGGYLFWRKRMNMESIDKTNSEIGWHGEDIVQNKLEELNFKVVKEDVISPYDFVVDDFVRVDSKYSHLYHGVNGNFYSCNLETRCKDCDIFIVVCEDDEGVQRFFVIPHTAVFNHKQISIGEYDSKWYKCENKFDIIKKYSDFYKSL